MNEKVRRGNTSSKLRGVEYFLGARALLAG